MNNINLLFSIPMGIFVIMAIFVFLLKVMKLEIYISAGILAIVVLFVYGILAIMFWPGADVFAIHLAIYLLTVYALSIITRSLMGKARLHWGPMLIVGFFAVVVMVDTLFITLAQSGLSPEWAARLLPAPRTSHEIQSRFPGTVSHDFREKEDYFNEYQQQRELQKQRGWKVKIGWQEQAVVAKRNTLILDVRDEAGGAISQATVSGRMLYPGNMKLDQVFSMSPQADGRYIEDLLMPHAGNWDFIIVIEKDKARHELRVSTVVHDTDIK